MRVEDEREFQLAVDDGKRLPILIKTRFPAELLENGITYVIHSFHSQ
jgi:hypothetical protein